MRDDDDDDDARGASDAPRHRGNGDDGRQTHQRRRRRLSDEFAGPSASTPDVAAPLHGSDELMNVSAELWFSSADDDEALPWSLSTHAYDVSAMYPSRTNLCRRAAHSACRSEGALAKLPLMRSKKQKCKALASAFTCVALPTKQHTVRLHGAAHRAAPLEPCASLATGPSAPHWVGGSQRWHAA